MGTGKRQDPEDAPIVEWAVRARDVRIWEDEHRQLHISVNGTVHDKVKPRRVFPLSEKSGYVSFMNEKDEEVVLLADPGNLEDDSAEALQQALERLYFAAIVTRVDEVTEAMGVSMWSVATNCGYARFEVVDRRRYIRMMPGGRFLITDADGNRFEIPCLYELDEKSRRLVETET